MLHLEFNSSPLLNMPPKVTVTEKHMNNIAASLTRTPILSLLNEFSDAFGTPFIPTIATTTLSLITLVENAKKNKEECNQLMENVHELLYAIILLHTKFGTGSSLSPAILLALGQFTKTLHKVHASMEVQQDGKKIKHFFRQNEMKTLLNECRIGLQQAVDMFKMESAIHLHESITEMQKEAERIHKELLDSILSYSDATISDRSSLIHPVTLMFDFPSSNSISMLPAKPKILHGQELEIKHIVENFHQEPARIAISSAGGMGKTSLAKAALHHPDIVSKYQHSLQLIGLHIGMKPGKDLTKPVVHYFSKNGPSLLILDNLETLWEPMESRCGFEDFLSSLTDVLHLALMANNFPLAVDLIAHLVDHEGCEDVLACWRTEKTSLLSTGHDRRSNLDISSTISLLSPRLSSGDKDLLSLLSILPDGLSNAQLLQSQLSIKNLLECRSMLLRTSLAYEDSRKQLNSLVPIREHMQQFYPTPPSLIHQVEKHFHLLLDVYSNHGGSQQVAGQLNQIMIYSLSLESTLFFKEGNISKTKQFLDKALVLAKSCGNKKQQATVLSGLACILWHTGDYFTAQIHAHRAQRLAQLSADLRNESYALWIEAMCAQSFGDYKSRCAPEPGQSKKTFAAIGDLYVLDYCDIRSGELNLRERETQTAKLTLEQCFNSAVGIKMDGDIFGIHTRKKNKQGLHKALQFLGDIFITQGDFNTAGSLFTVALETFTYMDIHHSRAKCMLRLGDILEQKGNLVDAVEFWKEARPLFEWALQEKEINKIDNRLAAADLEKT
ncbi:hypothetical protein C8R44DRAFT_724388 [Mycena epipterygia]|nr:hypothetical protein C8R44DRAFT_724388 [Mycena epipterygia]